jgi:flagellar hook-associated protein 3 FlgL
MRVSTSLFYSNGVRTMNAQQSDLMRLMQQLGTGKKILTPSDDPLGAAQSLNLGQTLAVNERLETNRATARTNLMVEETELDAVNKTLQDVRTRIIEAGNGTYSETEMRVLAADLKAHYDTLLSRANGTDGSGQFLFSGNMGDTAPFNVDTTSGYRTGVYQGDQGARLIQADATRQLSSADTATNVFARANPGAQGYVASANPANGGTVTFTRPDITNQAGALVGDSLAVNFVAAQPGPPPTYDYEVSVNGVVDPALAGSYDPSAGAQLSLGGVSFTLAGTPAVGDSISVEPFESTDMDMFSTLENLIGALNGADAGDPAAKTRIANMLNEANRKLTNNHDNVLTVRASVGTRINELDALDTGGTMRGLSYEQELIRIEDIDYRETISQLSMRSMALEAAQGAFMKIQGLSLFSR